MPEISLRDVSFSYPGGPRVLDRVSLEVEHGSFLAVVGPSGCGKSTLLRLISGLSLPEEGTVSIGGEPVTGPAPGRSIVFQQGGLFPWLTARGNVAFALRKARPGLTRAQAAEQAEAALIRVGLKDALSRYPGELSGGMAQRVAIARALAVGGQVLLLDEPFGALDPKNRKALQQLLLELWQAGEHGGHGHPRHRRGHPSRRPHRLLPPRRSGPHPVRPRSPSQGPGGISHLGRVLRGPQTAHQPVLPVRRGGG